MVANGQVDGKRATRALAALTIRKWKRWVSPKDHIVPDMALVAWAHVVTLQAGEYCVVPRGIEHRTGADEEAAVIVFEPASARNTGNLLVEGFTAPNGVRL